MNEPPVTGEWTEPTTLPTVPGYDLLGELGRGGMGVVYHARHAATGRVVALKVIRDGALAGPREVARFRTEAAATARLSHPNVVQVFEVGEHAGRPYFVMELVEGGSLDRHLAGRPLPAREAAELLRTLALAVAHAHERHVVHRDLKPANILLGARGDGQGASKDTRPDSDLAPGPSPLAPFCPKVTDFGLAKLLDHAGTAVTRDGAVVGTASYMAPEQAAGRVADVGPPTDVHALGATLYEVLTGRPPFDGPTWDETVRQVIHDDPAPPSRLRPDVPADLEAVCLKCLEKEPARRYQSAAALADDLGAFLAGGAVSATPQTSAERLARLAARDGYRIVGEVGRGPNSVVYQARTELNQLVAVKVFAAGAVTRDEWDARLRGWGDRWAALAHPQIVPVHAAGWWDGRPYVVTEYATPGRLTARPGGKPYPVREAIRLVAGLTEVVGYAHRQGVVHGNLKPANVLFAAAGIPRLIDFQLTGGLFQGGPDDDAVGVCSVAPELAADRTAEPRPHTDVYGLGLILYELLTGAPPFAAETPREALDEVQLREAEPPSRRNRDVTPALDGVVLRCLAKNPWWRFPRPFDLFVRLRGILGETPNQRR